MNAFALHVEENKDDAQVELHPLLAQVGNTPLLPLDRIGAELPPRVRLLAKAEWLNPSGSVKDRPAANILRRALAAGEFEGGKALLDSSSGNMGIAYATFGAALGLEVHLAVPANASQARLSTLEALGAHLTLTDPTEGTDGARQVAASLAQQEPSRYYFADQYSNPANWQAHYQSTGPELVRQSHGQLTHFVAGLGTSGTMVGAGRYLKESLPSAQLVAVQPDGPLHGLEGLKHYPSSHVPEIYQQDIPDRIVAVSTEDAYAMTRRLARQEGIFVGVSAGAAVRAALNVAADLNQGYIVALLPDTGLRYLGEPFWEEAG
jgi:cysteine synthase B